MPAADRLRPNEQTPPTIARKHSAKRAQHDPVGQRQTRPSDLPTENRQLVAQHQDLHRLPVIRSTTQNQQLDDAPEYPVDDGDSHPPIVPAAPRTTPHRVSGTHRVAQQARNLAIGGALERLSFLIRDRDAKFTSAFDTVFQSEGMRVIPWVPESRCGIVRVAAGTIGG